MTLYERLRSYAHLTPTIALFGGFVFDIFTLNRPDQLFENVVMLAYLTLSAIVIVLLQVRSIFENEKYRLLFLSVLQFAFGNLASALMILYTHSGTFAGGVIFIGLLGALFLGNELLRGRYARNTLRMGIWFFLLLSYCTLVVPVLTSRIGMLIFLLSVVLAVCVALAYIHITARVLRTSFRTYFARLQWTLVTIATLFTLLYLGNFIPPVPLATKHIGIYHDVVRIGNDYIVEYEEPKWYMFWRDSDTTVHVPVGRPLYCFSSIFAPGNLRADIYHNWEYFDSQRKTWISVARIPFAVSGGRISGYRGYTYITNLEDGKWRCRAETRRGAAMGQTAFTVQLVQEKPPTKRTKY